MRCRRAEEINVEDFLVDSASETFNVFREHYAECEECAAKVADWSALDWAIRETAALALPEDQQDRLAADSGGVAGHPAPRFLESFVISPSELGDVAMQIETHLITCGTCRSEVNLLRQFDPTQFLNLPAPENADTQTTTSLSWSERLANLMGSRGDSGFAPSLGQLAIPALLLAFAVAVSFALSDRLQGAIAPESSVQIAEGSTPGAATQARTEEREPAPGPNQNAPLLNDALDDERESATLLAQGHVEETKVKISPDPTSILPAPSPAPSPSPSPAPSPSPTSSPTPNQRNSPEVYAQAETQPAPIRSDEAPQPTAPSASAPGTEILLAALTELPLPTYQRPAGGPEVGWMGQFGPVRSNGKGPKIASLAPRDHTGLTLETSPHLWWTLSEPTEEVLQITIVDDRVIAPLLRVDVPGPHRAGVHEIDLASHNVELPPGQDYRWFVSVLVDPNRPSRNPVAAGALRVLPQEDARRSELGKTSESEQGHRLAALGIWYDAYDFFARLVQEHPEKPGLKAYRDELAKQVTAVK